jgi:arylsulfatase
MAIDILPTIASLTGAPLPEQKIDGRNVWPVLTGKMNESPHEAYFFYYHTNELHAVRSDDWKLYFPHHYRTLNGRKGGTGGIPVEYDYVDLEEVSLYNLENDPTENNNVAKTNPDIVNRLTLLADSMRSELGDALKGIKDRSNRPAGKATWEKETLQ